MNGLWLLPVSLIFLLLISEPLNITVKKSNRAIITVQTLLFSFLFLSRKQTKKRKTNIREDKSEKISPSLLKRLLKTTNKALRHTSYFTIGIEDPILWNDPIEAGVFFAVLCPSIVFLRNIIPRFSLFPLTRSDEKHSFYLSFEISLFSLLCASLPLLYHIIREEVSKGKNYASKCQQ